MKFDVILAEDSHITGTVLGTVDATDESAGNEIAEATFRDCYFTLVRAGTNIPVEVYLPIHGYGPTEHRPAFRVHLTEGTVQIWRDRRWKNRRSKKTIDEQIDDLERRGWKQDITVY